MASINTRNVHHLAQFGEPSGAKSEAEDAAHEIKDVSDIDATESEDGERPSALVKAYRSAVLELTEREWIELDEGEDLPIDHHKDPRRKRRRTGDGEAAIFVPVVALDPISDLDGPMLEPVAGVKESACTGADGSGFAGVDPPQSEGRGPAHRIAVHGADVAKAPEGARAPASDVEWNRGPGFSSVVEARVAEVTQKVAADEASAATARELHDAEEIRARNRAARSPAHGADPTHLRAADSPASTEDARAPERRERRHDPAPVAVAPPVDQPPPSGTGMLVNYRFKSWSGQPTVSLRLDTHKGVASLDVSTDDRRAEATMRQHADALSLDVPLRFDRGVVDEEGSNGSGQRRESDES